MRLFIFAIGFFAISILSQEQFFASDVRNLKAWVGTCNPVNLAQVFGTFEADDIIVDTDADANGNTYLAGYTTGTLYSHYSDFISGIAYQLDDQGDL